MIQLEGGDVFGLAAAVTAAVETGLLGLLAEGPAFDAAEAAARLDIDAAAAARVFDVLVATNVAARVGEQYVLAPDLAAMHRAFPGGLSLTTMLFAGTTHLVRTGVPVFAVDGDLGERSAAYSASVAGLGAMFKHAAAALAEVLAPDVAPGARVLDVGCGSGVWGLALAAQVPGARLTGVDLPAVLEVFLAAADTRGLGARVGVVAGDMHEVVLPTADVVVLANVLRLEPPLRAAALVARLARAVAPGGQLVVVDALAAGTPDREVARTVYALNLALRTRHAVVHAPEQVQAWMKAAGLVEVSTVDFGIWPGAVAAVVGHAPAV